MSTYTPPKVWTWDKPSGGAFANTNRPEAGPTHEAELPVGEHPLQLHSLATPNGVKVTIMLEELLALGHTGAEYDAWYVPINEGAQFSSGYVAANPNSKIPVLIDHSTTPPTRVFESGAILLHLAGRFGAFLPTDPRTDDPPHLLVTLVGSAAEGDQAPVAGSVSTPRLPLARR